jgi:hypothetical protein
MPQLEGVFYVFATRSFNFNKGIEPKGMTYLALGKRCEICPIYVIMHSEFQRSREVEAPLITVRTPYYAEVSFTYRIGTPS